MADYIYLLEHRLSPAQQRALGTIRNVVRSRDLTLFLTGGAVRDLTGGGSVRDLDFTIQGDITGLKKDLEAAGAITVGENPSAHALFFTFPGGVRVEVSAAVSVAYPKPGKPKYELATIADDLRRRDFTANAMALSLNEGSYGLLMDPLNGVADIENRELRLVSNYGFLDDPARMLRAVRLGARLGLHMEERTRQRYENAKADDAFANITNFNKNYELEEVFHEEDPLRILRALETEGWLKLLAPRVAIAKANEAALADLRDKQGQLQDQGILADSAALSFPLLVAKMPAADLAALKLSFARPGFVREIETIEERARELQTRFTGKDAATPSAAWKLLHESEPSLVLAMYVSGKGVVPARMKTFLTESPTARQRLPYALLQEMRITPELPVYGELLDKLFFELMDGRLATIEEMKAYLEPYSPPAPPPPVNLRRARAKKEARPSRAKAKKAATVVEQEEALGVAEGILTVGTLTGADRGTEPTVSTPLTGKVAPLAAGEPEAGKSGAKSVTKRAAKGAIGKSAAKPSVTRAAAIQPDAVSKKLPAKAAPSVEASKLQPHPAAREIAGKAEVVIPAQPPSKLPKAAAVRPTATAPAKAAGTGASAVARPSAKAASGKTAAAEIKKPAAKTSTGKSTVVAKGAAVKAAPAKTAPIKSVSGKATAKTASVPARKTSPAVRKAPAKKNAAVPQRAAVKPTAKKTPPVKSTAKKSVPAKAAPKKMVPAKKAAAVKPVRTAVKKMAIKTTPKAPAKKVPAKAALKKAAKQAGRR